MSMAHIPAILRAATSFGGAYHESQGLLATMLKPKRGSWPSHIRYLRVRALPVKLVGRNIVQLSPFCDLLSI
jgi:hypothetical protein